MDSVTTVHDCDDYLPQENVKISKGETVLNNTLIIVRSLLSRLVFSVDLIFNPELIFIDVYKCSSWCRDIIVTKRPPSLLINIKTRI